LHKKLTNSKALYFDDYDFIGPDDIIDWLDRGADRNEWDLTPLIKDINSVDTKETRYILIDYPFSRLHKDLKNFDLTFFIDTPLDIALSRRMIRDYSERRTEEILQDLSHYLNHGRAAYMEMLKTVRPDSDYIINGTLSIIEIVDMIYMKINQFGQQFEEVKSFV